LRAPRCRCCSFARPPAQTIDPFYAGSYSLTSLPIAGVPTHYGGMVFKAGDPNVLIIGGEANEASGRFYEVPVVRGAGNHIVAFGTPVVRGFGANNDGGIAYGPGGVLFYSQYGLNAIAQVKPGSNADNKVVALGPLGIAYSTGALNFVPAGYGGAGQLKVSSWDGGQFYTVTLAADGSGTYNLTGATLETTLSGGPEGFAYIPLGSLLFGSPSMLVSEYSDGNVAAYTIDANGNPMPGSRRTFIAGLDGAEGAAIDPLTGDFLFSTCGCGGSANRVIAVRGFALPGAAKVDVVEFYNAVLDHYFITWIPAEIANLDAGNTPTKWNRTGVTFKVYTSAQAGTSPVCRYYIPPGLGDSHFFGRGTVECNATGANNPSFILEEANFMFLFLPVAGVCPAGTVPVYRVFSNRLDANHRYMIDRAIRSQMVGRGWLIEGDGSDYVVMCVPPG